MGATNVLEILFPIPLDKPPEKYSYQEVQVGWRSPDLEAKRLVEGVQT